MDLNLLKTFDVVMKSKSVTEAAEALNVSAPAVSKALNRLREQYGDALFVREGRGIVPTNFARELHDEIKGPLVYLLNGSKSRTEFEPMQSERTFRLSSHKDIDLIFVPALVKLKRNYAPNITIDASIEILDENERQDALRKRRVDVIMATVPMLEMGYNNEIVIEQDLVVTASKTHPRIQGSLTKENFTSEKHLLWKTQRMNTNILDSVAVNEHLLQRRIAYKTDSTTAALMLAAETDWLCVTSRWHAEKVASGYGLNVFDLPFESSKVPVYMTWHQSQKNDRGHQWFREAIRKSVEYI
ncbi:LysR family transcriptional regulator [Vibrio mediterranei]|uniref:LysR family transcriptional regulator n=1 Tax=Vibrio mediterranei TaxID=689 RepID=UPI002283616F|nr:LysR family transcriptional regulator [Vibrio mediterranei]MCY9854140.1 LysR family transcriptional regulator [Vibrio mediterranei]